MTLFRSFLALCSCVLHGCTDHRAISGLHTSKFAHRIKITQIGTEHSLANGCEGSPAHTAAPARWSRRSSCIRRIQHELVAPALVATKNERIAIDIAAPRELRAPPATEFARVSMCASRQLLPQHCSDARAPAATGQPDRSSPFGRASLWAHRPRQPRSCPNPWSEQQVSQPQPTRDHCKVHKRMSRRQDSLVTAQHLPLS
jgi:hypothetical protein